MKVEPYAALTVEHFVEAIIRALQPNATQLLLWRSPKIESQLKHRDACTCTLPVIRKYLGGKHPHIVKVVFHIIRAVIFPLL